MRVAALMLIGAGLSWACKMPNPAFREDSASGTDGGSGTDSWGTGGDTDAIPGCHLDFGPPLAVRYDVDKMTCDDLASGYFAVATGPNGFALGGPCNEGCETCEEGIASLGPVQDLDLGDITCWFVENEAPIADPAADRCSFKAFTIWQAIQPLPVPLAVASSLDHGVPESAKAAFPTFEVGTKRIDQCECLPEAGCCDEANPPADYKLDIGGSHVEEGQTVSLLADPHVYSFTNVQSESTGACQEPRRIGWVMSLQP